MIVNFQTDNHVNGSEEVSAPLIALINKELSRFNGHITTIEVHLADENGDKKGENDKRCTIEAHVKGLKPVVATNHANTRDEAVKGAAVKLKSSLDTLLGKLSNH
jgi:hypothetical protein